MNEISQFILPFVSELVIELEPEFHSLWYFAFYACFNRLDPRRFFWLYNYLIQNPPSADNIRTGRAVSLVVDILLDVANRIPDLFKSIIKICQEPLFSDASLGFDQIRECSVRALISLVSLTVDSTKRGRNPNSLELLNRFAKDAPCTLR